MSRYQNGRNHRSEQATITPDDVYEAICQLAEAHATLPTQSMVADHLGCSQTRVSILMQLLTVPPNPRIVWLTQRVYYVDKSRWERLDEIGDS
jgi:hypothetical protein